MPERNPTGKLNAQEQREGSASHGTREDQPASAFLEPGARKYPVKVQRDGAWHYDRDLLLAAERDATMQGDKALADRARAIRLREFEHPVGDRQPLDTSARRTDEDGVLHLDKSHISKVGVCPYYGHEIPGYRDLGLDGDRVYMLLRPADELEKAAPTFARKPILSKHVPVTADQPRPDLQVGTIGSNVEFNHPYLDADLAFWRQDAIDGINSETKRELSSAYRFDPVMEPGEFEGQPYDGRMTNIRGNHLAQVEVGRAGPDVMVADRNPFEVSAMKKTKLGTAILAALSAMSPALAMDSRVVPLVAEATRKSLDRAKLRSAILAADAAIDSNKLDGVIDALVDLEKDPEPSEPMPKPAEDEPPTESRKDRLRKMLAGKVDEDTLRLVEGLIGDDTPDPDNDNGEQGMQAAMDGLAKSLREQFRDTTTALAEVRPIVGEVIGMDSADAVYGFALDHMKIDHADIKDTKALRALFKVAAEARTPRDPVPRDPQIAKDSANAAAAAIKQFPGLSRLRSAG